MMNHSALQAGCFELNVYSQDGTFKLKLQEAQTVKDLKLMIANTIICPSNQIMLLYGERILFDERGLVDSGIVNHSNIIVVSTSNGGDCLRFTQAVMSTQINGLAALKTSLDFLNLKEKIESFVAKAKAKVANIKQQKPELKNASEEGLVSIMLWGSHLLYRTLNQDLRGNGDFSRWNVYLKSLFNGMNFMPYFRGTAYRGLKNHQDLKTYRKGEVIIWKEISSFVKNLEVAKLYSNAKGTIFEVEVYSSRDIYSVSLYADEEEVLMPPYSCFEVVDVIEGPGKPIIVKMREIPTPRASKVVLWVDDNPEGNHRITKEIEENGMSCLFCVSTEDALKVINKSRWLLNLENGNFKIITNMRRIENGVEKSDAGAKFIEKLVTDYKYNSKVLIFCEDIPKAQEECNVRELNGHFSITNDPRHLRRFLNLH